MITLEALGSLAWRHWKLIAAGAVIATLAVLLLIRTDQRNDARQLARETKAAFDLTAANYRAAAEAARRRDAENVNRVKAEQAAITQEVTHEYQAALRAARDRADALRLSLAARANPRGPGAAQLPAVRDTAGGPDAAAAEVGFPLADRLIATEQALQLDALQDWVRGQTAVDPNGARDDSGD